MADFTYKDYMDFVNISLTEENVNKYEFQYISGKLTFSPTTLEINFLYSMAIHYMDIFIKTDKGRYNALFLKEDKYYKPIFYSLKAVELFKQFNNYSEEYIEIIKRIYTNLGNYYANQFRVYEALECYNNALFYDFHFEMAKANKLVCIEKIEGIKYYVDNAKLLYYLCDEYSVLETKYLEDGNEFFNNKKKHYEFLFKKAIKNYKNGKVKDNPVSSFNFLILDEMENTYTKWVLENCLYLNPLNSIELSEEAMQDKLNDMYWNLDKEQTALIIQLFENYLYYREKIYKNRKLKNDNELRECISTFKDIFSLFDQVAFFLHRYFDLDMEDKKVSYLRIFNGDTKCKNGNRLLDIHNTNLFALYWIKREYRTENDDLKIHNYVSSNCRELTTLRTKIEHRTTMLSEQEKQEIVPKSIGLLKIMRNVLLYLNALVYQESCPSLYKNGIRDTNLVYLSLGNGEHLFN